MAVVVVVISVVDILLSNDILGTKGVNEMISKATKQLFAEKLTAEQ